MALQFFYMGNQPGKNRRRRGGGTIFVTLVASSPNKNGLILLLVSLSKNSNGLIVMITYICFIKIFNAATVTEGKI